MTTGAEPPVENAMRAALSFDPDATADLIAAQAPFFPPGRQHGYAGMTFPYILHALIRRTDGRSLGRYFAEELAGLSKNDAVLALGFRRRPPLTSQFNQHNQPNQRTGE